MNLNREDVMQAITLGVKQAIHEMMESGDGKTGPIIRDYIVNEIAEKMNNAIFDAFPSNEVVYEAIKDGICLSMPNDEEILNAIRAGKEF